MFGGCVFRVDILGGRECNDQAVLDRDSAVCDDLIVLIHRDDVHSLYNQVDGWQLTSRFTCRVGRRASR